MDKKMKKKKYVLGVEREGVTGGGRKYVLYEVCGAEENIKVFIKDNYACIEAWEILLHPIEMLVQLLNGRMQDRDSFTLTGGEK